MSIRYNINNDINIKTHIYIRPIRNTALDDIKTLLEEDSKINIHFNENKNSYNSYKNIKDHIYRIIKKTEFLCKGLNSDYVLDSLDKVDAIVIISSSTNILPNGNIFGFALINFEELTNSIYIDTLSSHTYIKGIGNILISKIKDISKMLLITKIHLITVDSAILFYKKHGFTKYDKFQDDMHLMMKL